MGPRPNVRQQARLCKNAKQFETPGITMSEALGFRESPLRRGEDRWQPTWLLPSRLDDYVGEDSAARVIDVFVDELELADLRLAGDAGGDDGADPPIIPRPC